MVGDVGTLAVEAGQAIHHQAFPESGLSETSQGLKLEPAGVGKFLRSNLSPREPVLRDTGWAYCWHYFRECLSLIWKKILKGRSRKAVPVNVGEDARNFTDRMVLSLSLQIALLKKE